MKEIVPCFLGAMQLYHTFCFLIRQNFRGFWEANPEMDAVFAGLGGGLLILKEYPFFDKWNILSVKIHY